MHRRSSAPFAILLLITATLSCSLLRRKPPLTWQILLEIDAPASNREGAVNQTIFVIEKRLDALGVPNWAVIDEKGGRILVKLPSLPNPERLKRVLLAGGRLELTHVISPPSPAPFQTYGTKEEAIASLNASSTVQPNRRVLPYTEREDQGAPRTKWVIVESLAIVDGNDLRDASAAPSSYGEDYQIQFSLNKVGARKFGDWTGANINEYLGVVLNEEVRSIAYIKSQISDQGVISGRFTKESAEDLALVLRSGALPAPIKIVEERKEK